VFFKTLTTQRLLFSEGKLDAFLEVIFPSPMEMFRHVALTVTIRECHDGSAGTLAASLLLLC